MTSVQSESKLLIPDAGFCLIDKPIEVSSFDVVAAARGALKTRRVGHAGTLDPLASGLLLLGYGSLTHLLPDLTGEKKTYRATIRLGASTSTDDSEGDFVQSEQPPAITARLKQLVAQPHLIVDAIRDHLTGSIQQVPSTYSAVRIHGQHAYDLARQGEKVTLSARSVTIYSFRISDVHALTAQQVNEELKQSANPHNHVSADAVVCDLNAEITCSAGTYIRSLARDLGQLLHVGGYITQLRRTSIGQFRVADALAVSTREKTYRDKRGVQHTRQTVWINPQQIAKAIVPAADVVRHSLPWISLTDGQAIDVSFGRKITVDANAYHRLSHGSREQGNSQQGNAKPRKPENTSIVALAGSTVVAKGIIQPLHDESARDEGHLIFQPRTVLIPQMKTEGLLR